MAHDYAKEPFERLVAGRRVDRDGLAVAACLKINIHANGAMSIEGPIADKQWCRWLLDEAWAAINREQPTIVTPADDVDTKAKIAYPHTEVGR